MTMDRKETEALMVFLANGTLEGAERDAVEAAVAADPQLQMELEALRRIRAEMQADDVGRSPGQFGLARLMRDIDRERPMPQQEQQAQGLRPRVWQTVAAVAVGLLVLQSVIGWNGGSIAPGPDVVLSGGEEEGTILVGFRDGATLAGIETLLNAADVTIVDGPRANQLYLVRPRNPDQIDAAVARLQADTALVDSADPYEGD